MMSAKGDAAICADPPCGVAVDSPHCAVLADAIYCLEEPFIVNGFCEEANLSGKAISIDYTRKDGQSASITFPKAPASDRNVNPPKESHKWTNEHYKNVGLSPQFSAFLDDCEPSPFGHGSQTVFDSSVRKAMQIPGCRIDRVSFDVDKEGILDEVQRRLVPLGGDPIEATLDKLNVYGEGGHFKAHRDTPRDERCFGTLVVCLPSSFAGGNFDIWHGQKESSIVSLNWDKKTCPPIVYNHQNVDDYLKYVTGIGLSDYDSDRDGSRRNYGTYQILTKATPSCVQWAAFFGDCEHEISEVKAGYRITLTYILRYSKEVVGSPTTKLCWRTHKAASSVPARMIPAVLGSSEVVSPSLLPQFYQRRLNVTGLKDLCRTHGLPVGGTRDEIVDRLMHFDLRPYTDTVAMNKGSVFHAVLHNALSDPNFMPAGGILGVPCFHMYERASDVPSSEARQDIQGSDLRLKGADAFVYLAAAHLGLSPKAFTIIRENSFQEENVVALNPSWLSFEETLALTTPTLLHGDCIVHGLNTEDLMLKRGTMKIGDKTVSIDDFHETIKWLIPLPTLVDAHSSLYPARPAPLISCIASASDYFGNEADDSTVYANAVIAIPIPPYEERCSNPKVSSSSTMNVVEDDVTYFKGAAAPQGLLPNEEEFRAIYQCENASLRMPSVSWEGSAKMIVNRIYRSKCCRKYGPLAGAGSYDSDTHTDGSGEYVHASALFPVPAAAAAAVFPVVVPARVATKKRKVEDHSSKQKEDIRFYFPSISILPAEKNPGT